MSFSEIISFEGGINTDDTPQGVPKGDYRDFSYCRLGYNSGNAYAVETSDGTLVIPNPDIEIQDQIIGATPWQKTNSIVYFVFKANLVHEIWVYSIDDQTHTVAVQSSELNFSRDWPIFHANIIDDILKWTDGRWDAQMYDADGNRLFNPPYQINLQKALDNYYPVVDLQTLDAIKWPMSPPLVSYFTDPTRNDNKLRNKLFKFIIQPIYENGELGVWSMYSNLDLPQVSELVSGTNWIFPNNSNGIRIQFNTGPKIIRKFNLAVQQFDKDSFGTEPPFGVFLQLDKDQDNIADNDVYFFSFYGGVATSPAVDVFKNYDRLPVIADCQEYLPTNQLTYVNFREGYDKPTDVPFVLNVQMDYDLNEINWNPSSDVFDLIIGFDTVFIGTWRLQNLGWDASVNFPWNAGDSFSFPNPAAIVGYTLTQQDIAEALAWSPFPIAQNTYIFQILGDYIATQLGTPTGTALPTLSGLVIYEAAWPIVGYPPLSARVNQDKQTLTVPSLKSGATHEFGIVYGDRAYRDSTVYTVDSMNLFVPWFYEIDRSGLVNAENPFSITPRININHVPPIWATKYWVVAKPATEISSFGQYTTNANDVLPAGSPYVGSIKLDYQTNNRFIINIDRYYVNQNIGASIRHEIKVGDKVRFIRKRPAGGVYNATGVPYLPYLEVDVVDYDPVGGEGGRQAVYTNIFDISLIETSFDAAAVGDQVFGQLLEIYTPRPSIDDTGSVFVSIWQDVTEALDIINPHTEDRSHGTPCSYILYVNTSLLTPVFYLQGDYGNLNNQVFSGTVYYDDNTTDSFTGATITTSYNQINNFTIVTISGIVADARIWYVCLTTNINQVVTALNSTTAAEFPIAYGDVYLRQRNYQTGLVGNGAIYYYFIEDPHYSDYWSSNIHNDGRIRIEDPNARMTHRQSTAIHSDSFIVGTQINGLSSFDLNNQNIEDMSPIYGPVVRAYMSGREGKTLKCLQPKKENSIYIQFYPNEVGSDSTVRVSNKTFASWFDYKSLLGCSNSGATAILPNGSTMYFDNNAGVFVYSGANGQIQISEIDPETKADYKFRTKTKQLAAAYNASPSPMVRTYVNESVGEVGFAFRFDAPYSGEAQGIFNPAVGQFIEGFILFGGNYEYLYGYDMIITFAESGNVYSGTVNFVEYQPLSNSTIIGLDGVEPSVDDYLQPGYYYTTSGLSYDHVVFDYVNMRWRSTYDYNFQQFCNLGQTLVGWGTDNQLYVHNQPNQWNFHGDSFIQKVSFVSNENPLALKRYQDITLISDDLFSIEAESEPNRSYPRGMKTTMPSNLLSTYEGYGKVNYRKNLYDAKFFVDSNTITTSYDPPTNPVNGWVLPGDQTSLLNDPLAVPPIPADIITIIQDDGNIYTGQVSTAVYDPLLDITTITLVGAEPGTIGVTGTWYFSERALCNGQDIRANALTHTLSYDPTILDQSSVLFSVGIKGVLS